jgi:hypothetical protein
MYMPEEVPILFVYHCGKLGGRYLCFSCLSDRERRREIISKNNDSNYIIK